MDYSWIDTTLAWIAAHPVLAGAVIFAIAFCDAVIILGAIVPALPLMIAVGVLIGMGEISGPYAVACATLGAFCGDGLSYWVGRRWGDRLRGVWPFSRYPQLLERGELLFKRNAFKSILVARYVGAIRPFVPAIAGMAKMPLARYAQPSAVASLSWAVLFLLPGWALGQAYDAVAAVAGRLFLVVALLGVMLGLVWAIVLYGYRWSAARMDGWLARLLRWSQRHPHLLGRYWNDLFDPRRRESVPLAMLALMLLLLGWGWFVLLMVVVGHGEPLALDLAVHHLMLALRNPLADYPMAALASLGDWQVLLPATAAGMGYLCWRRRWMAAAHWLAALAFGLALTKLLGATVDVVRPPAASSGFGFPSVSVTMATITFGFFAVLISRELPGRTRVWPYLVSGIVVTIIGFARLYLGAHWLSDVIGGMLFGIFWLLVLGIAYRRRFNRSFWVKPVTWLFYGVFLLAGFWYAPRNVPAKLAKFEPAAEAPRMMDAAGWWQDGWRELPARRNEFDDDQRWPLDVQVAGPLAPLQQQLERHGWKLQPQAGWQQALAMLDSKATPEQVPVLPATLDTNVESLLMLRQGAQPDELYALRLWPAPVRLQPGQAPLWLGSAQTLRYQCHFKLFGLWLPLRGVDPALEAVKQSLDGMDTRTQAMPESGMPLLMVRSAQAHESM
ncbi:MAG: VTT domain-containing protein [Stenotrophomonas nitritireducens]|uniref:bifunctional DedA family/phosphatase PAP2 family protein n=1 Tax=Stenotrophomonas nitritireducens TaxID=83617 RepID=UPI001AC318D0|nr:bifunctional DedA family/phosphatase PAP2 family protein [Stenotrophomonas nitritireducens]MBN8792431.1 VTT domain-containing protein [Stenotrophomonas nitritireducens]MBN8796836.1 VTT domain-containing protein [Stenotrophomonas nitritireducens]